MKAFKFTPLIQKWALTVCLTAALGFSVSHNSHFDGFAAIDMASSDDMADGELATEKGVVPFKFTANGSDKTMVMVKTLTTEGTVCTTCENKIVTVSGSLEENKKNIAALNVKILQALKGADKPAEIAKRAKPVVQDDPDLDKVLVKEENFTDKKLQAILDKCEGKDDKGDVLECESSALISLMDNYKDSKDPKKTLQAAKLQAFSRRYIEGGIASQIKESRRIATLLRRGVDLSTADMGKDPEEIRNNSLTVIQNMLEGVPGKYEVMRKSLMAAEVTLTNAELVDAQQNLRNARSSNDPSRMQAANLQFQDSRSLIGALTQTNQQGLNGALSMSDVNQAVLDSYMTNFNDYTRRLQQAIAADPFNFQIPQSNLQQSGTIIGANGQVISGIAGQIDPSKTNVIIIQGDRSGRDGSQFAGVAANVTTPATPGTIIFTAPQKLTPEQARMRDLARGAQAK